MASKPSDPWMKTQMLFVIPAPPNALATTLTTSLYSTHVHCKIPQPENEVDPSEPTDGPGGDLCTIYHTISRSSLPSSTKKSAPQQNPAQIPGAAKMKAGGRSTRTKEGWTPRTYFSCINPAQIESRSRNLVEGNYEMTTDGNKEIERANSLLKIEKFCCWIFYFSYFKLRAREMRDTLIFHTFHG